MVHYYVYILDHIILYGSCVHTVKYDIRRHTGANINVVSDWQTCKRQLYNRTKHWIGNRFLDLNPENCENNFIPWESKIICGRIRLDIDCKYMLVQFINGFFKTARDIELRSRNLR